MFHLVTLHVKDMEKSLGFYRGLMGMPLVRELAAGPAKMAFLGAADGVQLELIALPGGEEAPRPAGFSLGFAVADIAAARDRLLAAAVPLESDIRQVGPGTKIAFFTGPDGESVELVEE